MVNEHQSCHKQVWEIWLSFVPDRECLSVIWTVSELQIDVEGRYPSMAPERLDVWEVKLLVYNFHSAVEKEEPCEWEIQQYEFP
jgi:hypothetical protein